MAERESKLIEGGREVFDGRELMYLYFITLGSSQLMCKIVFIRGFGEL